MPNKLPFALNHMAAPAMPVSAFLNMAAKLGCIGVELRNDLADKGLADSAFLDGLAPETIATQAKKLGLRLLGFSEAYGFNDWNPAMRARVALLIDQAKAAGAETINLIPRNDAPALSANERFSALTHALGEIAPMLEAAGIIGLIEPLGFVTSSLRDKAEAIRAIEETGTIGRFKLVHDTFHHHLAGAGPVFAEYTGIVHISGVVDETLSPDAMADHHRVLVDERDQLGNLDQIRQLRQAGYQGAFSFEPFSPQIHALNDPAPALAESMGYISAAQ